MEPLTTTAMIGTVVGYLAKKLKDNKSLQDFFGDFTDATVRWVRPLFLKSDNAYEKIIADLINKPDSPIKRRVVETAIASHLEDTPDDVAKLQALYDEMLTKTGQTSATNTAKIRGDNNKIYQGIQNSTITDSSVNQTHSGEGDNVAGDKKVYNSGESDEEDL